MNKYKRISRHLSPETRAKLSAAQRGKSKSEIQKERTRISMLKYWSDDRNFPADADEHNKM